MVRVGLLLVALVASTPALAADLKLERATIGFKAQVGPQQVFVGAVSGLDAWLPCEVVLTNKGSQPFAGTLRLEEVPLRGVNQGRRPLDYRRRVSLEPGATKRLRFPILYDGGQGYRLWFDHDDRGATALANTGSGGGIRRPHELPPTQPLVLVSRRREAASGLLSHLDPAPPPNQLTKTREWFVAEVSPESLPDDALLYHRVAALVVDDLPLGRFDRLQQEAILAFVARGGQLWISAVTRAEEDADSPLARALPGKSDKVRTLGDLEAVQAITGLPSVLPKVRSVRTFLPGPGATPWSPAREVVHRRHGQGRIVLAGYRLTDSSVPGGEATIRSLLKTRASPRISLPSSFGGPLLRLFRGALRETTRKAVPSLGLIVALLSAYMLLAVVVPFLLVRRSGRLERAWLAVAALALAGTGGVALLGRRYEQPSQAIRLSLVEGGRLAGPHQQVSLWALFSQTGGWLPLQFAHDRVVPFPYENSSPERLRSDASRATVATHPQDTTLLITTEPVVLPGGLRFHVRGPLGARLENEARTELIEAWAFGDSGEPLRLSLPKGLNPLSKEESTAFSASLEAAQQLARNLAQNRSHPLLLWAARSASPLGDLPERGLTLGLLPAEDYLPPRDRKIECLPRLTKDDYQKEVREWECFATLLPGLTAQQVSLAWRMNYPQYGYRRRRGRRGRSPYRPQIYDRVRRRWLLVGTQARDYPAAGLVHQDPLGFVRIRLRLVGPPSYEPRAQLVTGGKR